MEEEIEELERDMTPVLLEDLGMRFATKKSKKKSKRKYRYGLYKCQYCGKEWESIIDSVQKGHTKSCGCLYKRGNGTKHSLVRHPLYKTWNAMKHRCYNHKYKSYKDYGGRGIAICDRWMDIEKFIEDMFPTWEEGLSLDRIDVNGNYCVDNCRWVTNEIQHRNTRDIQSNNTSGFRGVHWYKGAHKWVAQICVNNKRISLGSYPTALEAAKAYETYVRLNNLEHNFTPALTPEEIEKLNKQKEEQHESNT